MSNWIPNPNQAIPLPDRTSAANLAGKEGYAVKLSTGEYDLASDGGADAVGILVYGGAASGDVCSAVMGRVKAVFGADHTATHIRDISVMAGGLIAPSTTTEIPIGHALHDVDISESAIGEIWFLGTSDEATA